MKRKTRNRIGFVLFFVLTLIALASTPISNALPLPPQVRDKAWPLYIGLAVLSLIGAAIYWVWSNRGSPDASLKGSKGRKFLKRLQAHYRQRQQELLDGGSRMELTLCKQSNVVTTSRQQGSQPSLSCFPSTDLLQMSPDAQYQLLILGEPGCGKTMLLYELAVRLLEGDQHNQDQPIPVVLNLSSWASKQQPLTDWLVEALGQQYKNTKGMERFADPTFAQWLVNQPELFLLLDGLDEVPAKCRRGCIDAINSYLAGDDLNSVVVCSRTCDDLTQNTPLRLQGAVVIQPLTQQQINEYIAALEQPSPGMQQSEMLLEGLRQALAHDQELLELATIPLWLHLLTSVYNGVPVEQFRAAGSLTKRQQVFETYVNRMLDRRNTRRHYPPPQARRYLQCLAQQMMYCNLAEFRVEQIEPEWLPPDHRAQQFYHSLAVRLVVEVPFLARSVVLWALLVGLWFSTLPAIIGALTGGFSGLVSGYINNIPIMFIFGGIFGVMREAYNVSTGDGGADQRFPFFKQALQYSGYLRFLDYATACLLLRNGKEGRYAFMHRLLLEYFATLQTPHIPERITTSVYERVYAQGRFSADKVLEIVRRKQAPPEWKLLPGDRPLLPGCFPTLMWCLWSVIPIGLIGTWLNSTWPDLHWLILPSIVTLWLASPFVVAFYKLHQAKRYAQLPATVIITPLGVVDYKDEKHMQTIDFARVTSMIGQVREHPQGQKLEYLSIDYVDRTHEDYYGLQTRYLCQPTIDNQYTGGIILPRYQPTRMDLCAILNAYDQIFEWRLSAYLKKNVSDTAI